MARIFLKFWIVLDFLQKLLAWFSKFYLRVQIKNAEKIVCFCFLFRIFFGFWAKIFRLLAKKHQEFVKTTFYVSRGTVCGLIFLKFWIVSDFLQKPLAWFSKFFLRVQSKNCGKNSFFCFLSGNFSSFEQKFFRLLAKKHKKLWELTSACPQEQLVALKVFKKFWTVLDVQQKPLAWFSKFNLRVQSKICGRNNFFLFFLSDFFRILSENFFRFLAKKCQKFVKTKFYVSRVTICFLNFF